MTPDSSVVNILLALCKILHTNDHKDGLIVQSFPPCPMRKGNKEIENRKKRKAEEGMTPVKKKNTKKEKYPDRH